MKTSLNDIGDVKLIYMLETPKVPTYQSVKKGEIIAVNGQSAEKDFAYILGLYFGDAYIKQIGLNKYEFRLQAIDKDFVEYVAAILTRISEKEIKSRELSRKTSGGSTIYEVNFCNEYFKRIIDDTNECRFIPDYVFEWPLDLKMAFLSAVMDSDGYISMRTNGFNYNFNCGYAVTYPWVLDMKRLFESVGIHTKKVTESIPKPPRKPFYRFGLVLKDMVTTNFKFHAERKQRKLDEYRKRHFPDGEYKRFTHKIKKPNVWKKRRNSQRLHDKTEKG